MRSIKPSYQILTLVITFVLGLAIGFVGRPIVIKDLPTEAAATDGTKSDRTEVAQATATPQPTTPPTEAESDTNKDSPTPTIMDFLLSDARHIQGNASAPVTIVEFSDFK